MRVMKFGGASIKDAAGFLNVRDIICQHLETPLLVVISASGKTTNHLEELAALAKQGDESAAKARLDAIANYHDTMIEGLFEGEARHQAELQARMYYQQIRRVVEGILLLGEFPPLTYDRIVAYGELLSSTIAAGLLRLSLPDTVWLDAREIIKTDENHQQAQVIWCLTQENIEQQVRPLLQAGRVVLTQGFIASGLTGRTTTLGREGSDYSAAIFANCLDAQEMIIWKDVPGVLNADPRRVEKAEKIDRLSYEEAVEMTYYGATVIHPKTIKPLYNKQIPLKVKCFLDTALPGTVISAQANPAPVPYFIFKDKQALIHIQPLDFSFADEACMQEVFQQVRKTGVKVNLVQHSAISLSLCTDYGPACEQLAASLIDQYKVEIRSGLQLATILNFSVRDLKKAAHAAMVQQQGHKLFYVQAG